MNVGIAGLGLIGGSFAKAAKRAGHRVFVWNRTRPTAETALAEGAADGILDGDFSVCDIILVALPPSRTPEWIEEHRATFRKGAVVVDSAGVKGPVSAALGGYALHEDGWTFVGGHPMAGKEVAGYGNSAAGLFDGASMILVPFPSCGRKTLDLLDGFFRGLGFGRVVTSDPDTHDRMIALTSQLAHAVSSAYVRDPLAGFHAGFSAGSFADMTRVAGVDPAIWTELFLANRRHLSGSIGGLVERLSEMKAALDAGDGGAIRRILADSAEAKRHVAEAAAGGTGRRRQEPLVLASASPRRAKILQSVGVAFDVIKTSAEEISKPDDPAGTVTANALRKLEAAEKILDSEGRKAAVLAADTIVWLDGRIYGKPRDFAEAAEFLRELSGKTHTVFTGLAFKRADGERAQCAIRESGVTFRALSEDDIESYIRDVRPLDRAGAYDIDESGDRLVESWTGSYSNIMGLPEEPVLEWLSSGVPAAVAGLSDFAQGFRA